jgi:hypothetical protein
MLKFGLFSDIVEAPSVVGMDDLQVLLDHLRQAHPLP